MLKQRLVRFALIHFEDQAPMMQISVKKDFVVQPREMMTANWRGTPKDKDNYAQKEEIINNNIYCTKCDKSNNKSPPPTLVRQRKNS